MENNNRSELLDVINWGKFSTAGIICVSMVALYVVLLSCAAGVLGANSVKCFTVFYFRGVVGIPCAIIMPITIVALLASSVGGEFKIKVLGMDLEGPSAPITMWVVCFLALILSIYVLFPKVDSVDDVPAALAEYCKASTAF
jgi:hypothetical protein